jgi:putative CRISPR-associated protein (TIGR02619 family)
MARGIAPIYKIRIKGLGKPARDATRKWVQQNVTEALTGMRRSVAEHVSRLLRKASGLQFGFNCTDCYKAESAVLYEVGRTLRLPVYYLHETFKTCVTLP